MYSLLVAVRSVFLVLVLTSVSAQAATTWDGSDSSIFTDPNNWTPAIVPTGTDDVIIPAGTLNDPVISTARVVQSLTLTASGGVPLTLTISAGSLTTQTLTTSPGAGASEDITISIGGTLEINGSSSTSSLNSTAGSTTTITGLGAFLTTTGDTLEINGDANPIVIQTSTVTLNATTSVISGQLTVISAFPTAENVVVTGSTFDSVLRVQGSMNIDNLTLNASSTHIADLFVFSGSVTVGTSCITNSDVAHGTRIRGAGTFTVDTNATMTVNATTGGPCDIPISIAAFFGELNLSSGTLSGDTLIFSSAGASGDRHYTLGMDTLLTTTNLDLEPGISGTVNVLVNANADLQVTTLCQTRTGANGVNIGGAGTFTLSGGTMTIGTFFAPPVNFSIATAIFEGDLNVANAELEIDGGPTAVFAIRGDLTGGGIRVMNGSKLNVDSLGQLGGAMGSTSISFEADCTVNFDTTQNGTFTLTSSSVPTNPTVLTASVTPVFGATAHVTINSTNNMVGDPVQWNFQGNLRNDGELTLSGEGKTAKYVIPNSTNFRNTSGLFLRGDTSGQAIFGDTNVGALINETGATIETSGAPGGVGIACTFTNNGTVDVTSGDLALSENFTQTDPGAVFILSTSTSRIQFNNGATMFTLTGGRLQGIGTITGNVTNGARIYPGDDELSGTLTIDGTYSENSSGRVYIDFTSDSVFDKLIVQGSMTFAGSPVLNLVGAYVPAANTVFAKVFEIPGGQSINSTIPFTISNETAIGYYFVPQYVANDVDFRAKTLAVPQAQSINVAPETVFNGTLISTDADGDAPTFLLAVSPTKGVLNITNAATGTFTYTPNQGATGADTFGFRVNDGTLLSAIATVTVSLAATVAPPVIASATPSPNPAKIGSTVTFTAVASDPASLPLTYSWDFQDGQPHTMGNPITHVFPSAGTFTVILRVFNGSVVTPMNVSIDVLGPNSGAETITNVGDGKEPVTNPLNGIMLSIASSNGGVVELAVDLNALIRESFDVNTGFDTIKGRQNVRKGLRPTEKFVEPGLAVATTVATDAGSTTERGKARRQIAVSSREVGQAPPFTTPPVNRTIEAQSIKGKFLFSSTKPDQFTFTGMFELPEGLDVSQERTLEIGIGNVIDAVAISAKGKSSGPALNRISKAQIKYPKVSKENPLTSAGQMAKLTLTMKGVNFSSIGFDTEGIAATLRGDEAGLKAVPRAIQAAISFAGSTWEGSIPVDFKLAKKADSGTIQTRRAN